jgi:hypothetical protein
MAFNLLIIFCIFLSGDCLLSDIRVWNSSVYLLKNPEHTWGLYSEFDTVNWANDRFHPIQYISKLNGYLCVDSKWICLQLYFIMMQVICL